MASAEGRKKRDETMTFGRPIPLSLQGEYFVRQQLGWVRHKSYARTTRNLSRLFRVLYSTLSYSLIPFFVCQGRPTHISDPPSLRSAPSGETRVGVGGVGGACQGIDHEPHALCLFLSLSGRTQ